MSAKRRLRCSQHAHQRFRERLDIRVSFKMLREMQDIIVNWQNKETWIAETDMCIYRIEWEGYDFYLVIDVVHYIIITVYPHIPFHTQRHKNRGYRRIL